MHGARHQPDSSDTPLGAGGGQRTHITCSALGQHQPPAQHCLKSSPSARDAVGFPMPPTTAPLLRCEQRGTNHRCWGLPTGITPLGAHTQHCSNPQTLSSQSSDSSGDLFKTFHLLQGNVPFSRTPTLPKITCLALPANPAWPCLRPCLEIPAGTANGISPSPSSC